MKRSGARASYDVRKGTITPKAEKPAGRPVASRDGARTEMRIVAQGAEMGVLTSFNLEVCLSITIETK